MSLTFTKFEALSVSDFDSALENKLPESRTLDYKRELPIFSDDGKRELLADVSAMANTLGGLLIYGIEEEVDSGGRNTGVPSQSVYGVVVQNEDELKLKLHSVIRDGLNPRLPGVEIGLFAVQGKSLLVISIPKSLYSPHAVWLAKSGKFFRRNDSGKYQVDPAELREMYSLGNLWTSQLEDFRKERVRRIRGQEILSNLENAKFVLIQVLPYGRLDTSVDIFNPSIQEAQRAVRESSPVRNSLNDYSTNFDGLICFQTLEQPNPTRRYLQAFTFGGVEQYAADVFELIGSEVLINGAAVQLLIEQGVIDGISLMNKRWGVTGPYAVLLTISCPRGAHAVKFTQFYGNQRSDGALQAGFAAFPPLVLTSAKPTKAEIEPLVRHFWRAFGEEFPLAPL